MIKGERLASEGIRQSLNAELPRGNVHNGHTRNLPNAPLEVFITGGHNITLVLERKRSH
jgi:hypothetical protein